MTGPPFSYPGLRFSDFQGHLCKPGGTNDDQGPKHDDEPVVGADYLLCAGIGYIALAGYALELGAVHHDLFCPEHGTLV